MMKKVITAAQFVIDNHHDQRRGMVPSYTGFAEAGGTKAYANNRHQKKSNVLAGNEREKICSRVKGLTKRVGQELTDA